MSDLPRLSEMHAETEQIASVFFRLIWRSIIQRRSSSLVRSSPKSMLRPSAPKRNAARQNTLRAKTGWKLKSESQFQSRLTKHNGSRACRGP